MCGEGAAVPPNIHLHGFLDRSAYLSILARADVGIGTLALHRKGMEEASPLKVREYLACGIPILLAYEDTDLSGANFDFVLQISNTEDNLRSHVEDIRQFAFDMQGRRANREAISPLIDIIQKNVLRLKFLEDIVRTN